MALRRSRVRVSLGPQLVTKPLHNDFVLRALLFNAQGRCCALNDGHKWIKEPAVAKGGSFLDKVKDRVREALDDLDRLLRPEQPKPARVPVPVRVRPEQRYPQDDPYRR